LVRAARCGCATAAARPARSTLHLLADRDKSGRVKVTLEPGQSLQQLQATHSLDDLFREALEVFVRLAHGPLMASDSSVGWLQKEHRLLRLLSHRHEGAVILELPQTELIRVDVEILNFGFIE
jgi:hypothetical protein